MSQQSCLIFPTCKFSLSAMDTSWDIVTYSDHIWSYWVIFGSWKRECDLAEGNWVCGNCRRMRIKGTLAWWMGGQGHAAVRYIAICLWLHCTWGVQALTFYIREAWGTFKPENHMLWTLSPWKMTWKGGQTLNMTCILHSQFQKRICSLFLSSLRWI